MFFKLVAHQKKSSLGAHFDNMIVTFSADGQPVRGAVLREAKSGCELHRLAGQPDECWCCGYDEQLEFVSQNEVPLAHADERATLPTTAKNQNNRNLLAASKQLPRIRGIT
ncbi:hypothetical protein [Janthinobacterium sp. JC611]|uniref:hypothetical protein n=1 Tax=Janthinobacterium sp. JC611 TaxID=2816201 RepID=UPI001BFDA59F|nr:hypothetical protein [Janthinobacterium sp. JC611]